ncbi:hypothetical protein [Streptomyces fagopyri]|uniref:hypothetical protein n=1 Tax=Streptomyces fagopyri TaxID=2662397 RepID=UPI0037121124
MTQSVPATIAQFLSIADCADRRQLAPTEVARLRAGPYRVDGRKRRPNAAGATWGVRAAAVRREIAEFHYPVQRGAIATCAECSGWDGPRCVGLVTQ